MTETAPKSKKDHVLITDVGSFLGRSLAEYLISSNCVVYGIGGGNLPHHLLSSHDFTLLEIDLSQPLPAYLPQFDLIFDLSLLKSRTRNISQIPDVSPQLSNTVSLSQSQNARVFIFSQINTSEDFYGYLTKGTKELEQKINMLQIGDLYGPKMPLHEVNKLTDLIKQAIKTDKIILENEGLDKVYPAFISDVLFAVNKFVFSARSKHIHYLVCEESKSQLSVSYEIQNAMRIVANKDIELFFSGPQTHFMPEPEVALKIHELGFAPKVQLAEGIKKTIEYFRDHSEVEESKTPAYVGQPQTLPQSRARSHIESLAADQKNKLPKVTSFNLSLNFRTKKVILFLVVAIMLTVLKTGLDMYLGQKNLKQAQDNIAQGNFEQARKNAKNARESFTAATNKVKFFTFPLSLINKEPKGLANALEAASIGSSAAVYFIEGIQALAHDFSIIAKPDVKNEGFDLELPAANFKKSYLESSQAVYLINSTQSVPFKGKIEAAKKELETLHLLSQRAYEVASLTDEFTGRGGKKTYLVLLQNNTELRPGGGFIGNFALLEFDQGRLQNISVEDIYTIDGQLKEKIEPPIQIKEKLGINNLYLRDSNWSGDYELNARTARDFFKKETGKDVDGVIALDLTLVQNVLSKMGPLTLSDYQEEITAENLFDRGEYYSEVGFFPGSTQKRDFFGALTRAMVAKVLDSLKNQGSGGSSLPWLALIEGSAEGLPEKHLMMTFDNPTIASFVKTKGWNQPMPPIYFNPADDIGQTRDYIALVEANVGANKVNRFMGRDISYEMTIGKDADLVGKLTINYTNNSQADTWPGGKYVNYLRVYVPFAAGLFEYKNGDDSNIKNAQSVTQGNLTVLSTYVEVPVKSKKEVSFTYRIPKNIKLEDAPTYSIYFQKQAGTGKDPLQLKFNLPGYLTIRGVNDSDEYEGSQNIILDTDLSTDRLFTIDLAKK